MDTVDFMTLDNTLGHLAYVSTDTNSAARLLSDKESWLTKNEGTRKAICAFARDSSMLIGADRYMAVLQPRYFACEQCKQSEEDGMWIRKNAKDLLSEWMHLDEEGKLSPKVQSAVGYFDGLGIDGKTQPEDNRVLSLDVLRDYTPSKEYELCIYGEKENMTFHLDEDGVVKDQNFDGSKTTPLQRKIARFVLESVQDSAFTFHYGYPSVDDTSSLNQKYKELYGRDFSESVSLQRLWEDIMGKKREATNNFRNRVDKEILDQLETSLVNIAVEAGNQTATLDDFGLAK